MIFSIMLRSLRSTLLQTLFPRSRLSLLVNGLIFAYLGPGNKTQTIVRWIPGKELRPILWCLPAFTKVGFYGIFRLYLFRFHLLKFTYSNFSSENYVVRRQSLKLLGELLLDRHNFNVMTRYISNPDNLKLMMNMLKEKSKNIQFEAFHVFKVGYCKYLLSKRRSLKK
jgi:hypothetical protein